MKIKKNKAEGLNPSALNNLGKPNFFKMHFIRRMHS
jgi:hypothetical protein